MSSYPPVLTKRDFVRRFMANEFGNRGPNWNTLEEFLKSDYKGLVHLRSRLSAGAGKYNVPAADVELEWAKLKDTRDTYLAGMAPHHRNLIQGNVQVVPHYAALVLEYADWPALPMRDAFAKGAKRATGIIATSILRTHLCPNSFEWLQTLLRRYPGHTVEFSTFSCNWGTLPNFNSVFWETRLY